MATTIPIEVFELLEDKIGREEAKEVKGGGQGHRSGT